VKYLPMRRTLSWGLAVLNIEGQCVHGWSNPRAWDHQVYHLLLHQIVTLIYHLPWLSNFDSFKYVVDSMIRTILSFKKTKLLCLSSVKIQNGFALSLKPLITHLMHHQ